MQDVHLGVFFLASICIFYLYIIPCRGWFFDADDGQIVRSLTTRVSLLTGLDTSDREERASAEPFQIVNYGLGGQYDPHLDYFDVSIYKYLIKSYQRHSEYL